MRKTRKSLAFTAIAVSLLALILDSQTALNGAYEGIELCIRTVIPSLFPFFMISIVLTAEVSGAKIPLIRPLCKLCKLPNGTESILLTGFLGGYPIGAQSISNSYASGHLSKEDAQRMLGFCNNAGPAFLFGMVGQLFDSKNAALFLWLIHIASAIMTGIVLPREGCRKTTVMTPVSINTGQVMTQSIRAMANVCGWVVIFRVILHFVIRWFLWYLPQSVQVLISGVLELSNGCIELSTLESCSVRFVYAAVFLALGGICVLMQTASAVSQAGLDLGMYIPGKVIQTAFSCILAVPAANLLFPLEAQIPYAVLPLPLMILGCMKIFLIHKENNSSIPAFTGV